MPGIEGEALRVEIVSGFMRPARMKPSTVGEVANIIWVSPARSDCAAGPPPLYCSEVRRGAEARGRVEELAWILSRIVDELAQADERLAVVHHQHGCARGHAAHGGEILLLVVRALVERDVDRVVPGVDQRVAVSGRLGNVLRGDVAA